MSSGEVVPPILTAEEIDAVLTRDAMGDGLRDDLSNVCESHEALRVQFNAWEEERDRADAEEARADQYYDDLNDPFATGLRTRAEEAEALAAANDALYHWAFKRMETAEARVRDLTDALSADRIESVLAEHRMDDEARTCTCGDWKWEPGPARPSELHRMHVAHMIAKEVSG